MPENYSFSFYPRTHWRIVTFIVDIIPTNNRSVVMRKEREVYSVSCIGVLPFIEGSLRDCTSGLVAVSHDSEEHA